MLGLERMLLDIDLCIFARLVSGISFGSGREGLRRKLMTGVEGMIGVAVIEEDSHRSCIRIESRR